MVVVVLMLVDPPWHGSVASSSFISWSSISLIVDLDGIGLTHHQSHGLGDSLVSLSG
jgi:hypothetical protein